MSGHSSHLRNVRSFDGANLDVVLGGLILSESLTEKNFLTVLQMIVLVITSPIRVSVGGTGRVVFSMVCTRLDVGDYIINCERNLSTMLV